jgi:sulfide:quinone oxidoreductase
MAGHNRPPRTALILGGGVGGVVAATRLRARLPRGDRVILVDRAPAHLFQPSLLWLGVGKREPRQLQRPLGRLARKGIEVVEGEIESIDPATRTVRVSGRDLQGDALVITLGADLAPELVPGLEVFGHNLYTLAGASAMRDALDQFNGGRVVVLTAAPAYKCPAAPYEAAMLVQAHLRSRGASGTPVEMFVAEPGPMGTAGPEVSAAVRAMVESHGVAVHPNRQVERVEAGMLHFTSGAAEPFDLLLYVPPHRAPGAVRSAGLTGEHGWIPVDPATLETGQPGVFAIGDVTGIPLPSGKLLPKAGVFAHHQAEVVAANIAAAWAGEPADRRFDGTGACFIETGHGRAGYGSGNFYASPLPAMRLRRPSRWWHLGKVLFEQQWLRRWF